MSFLIELINGEKISTDENFSIDILKTEFNKKQFVEIIDIYDHKHYVNINNIVQIKESPQ